MFQTTKRMNGRKISIFSACFLLTALLSVSCKKDAANFGTDVLSPEDLLASGGVTFDVVTYSVPEDSFPTDNQLNAVLGSMHDPKMGIVNAAFYTQFDFQGEVTHTPGDVPVMDSVIFSLRYSGYYGKLAEQTFQVHEVIEDLDIDSTYYKDSQTATNSTDLVVPSSATQTPDVYSEFVEPDGDTLDPQLRLKLDNAWGTTIVTEAINGSSFENTESLQAYFKGLKVSVQETAPSAGEGGLIYFNLGSADTKITFYYHIVGDTNAYNLDLDISGACADYNQVTVDNTGYPVEDVIDNPINGQTQLYAQAFQTRAVVEFPSVSDIPENSVIHAALLELPIAYQTGNLYYPSVRVSVIFESKLGTALLGVIYDEENKRYVVDVRDYLQEIVNGDIDNTGIFLSPTYFTATGERIIFNGSGTSFKTKPKLIVKYTTF